jgi:hypothetical protein
MPSWKLAETVRIFCSLYSLLRSAADFLAFVLFEAMSQLDLACRVPTNKAAVLVVAYKILAGMYFFILNLSVQNMILMS